MTKNLIDKGLNDGIHIYYHDGNKINKVSHENKNDFINDSHNIANKRFIFTKKEL